MTISPAIFRAYDIRGTVPEQLNQASVYNIARAIGSESITASESTVIVGRDGRLSGPELVTPLIDGLLASGCDVIDIGVVPSPVLYFATHTLPATSGVILTGSHNPSHYNGLKIVIAGETLAKEKIQILRQRIEQQQFSQGAGTLSEQNINDHYIRRICSDIQLKRPLKVAIDCGNGVAGMIAPQLFTQLGCQVIPLYCDVDGSFPNHHPDPTISDNLRDLIALVVEQQADIGFAFDGDADRLGVITNKGSIIWPDRQMILFANDVLTRNPGATIVYDVKCTAHLGKQIQQHGGNPIMSQTGHSLLKAKMKAHGAALAGEMSGHIFFQERWFGFDDGLYTACRLLEILANTPHTAEQLFAEIPNSSNTPELKIEVPEAEKFKLIEQLKQHASFPDAHAITIDGLRMEYPDGWGLVRASNTTPCLVLRFEADNDAALQRIQNQFKQQLLCIDQTLKIPF